ncbi:Uncharacterized protein MLTONO_p0242 (plasmid) [Mesorhizobium loti]|nr:Uncharacterized protein MLTONO_p0242 [Mesorhizobium loti]
MRIGDLLVFGAHRVDIATLGLVRQQGRDHADRPAGIGDIDGLTPGIARVDLHRRMHATGRRAADQQWNVEALALHLGRHVHHLVERRRDKAGQADDIDLSLARRLQGLGRRHHDAEIHDLVIVAGENDADDVLADVVDIALHRCHQDFSRRLALTIVDAIGGVRQLLGLHVLQ